MTQAKNFRKRSLDKYEVVPPEGGWGYVITFALSLMTIVTIVPVSVFGMVFGEHLATLGDETGSTTLINAVFYTVLFFTGLPANFLLQKFSYRKVGLLGAVIYFVGSFTTIIATTVTELVITFGVIQGCGLGLMLPAVFSAFNEYFLVKQNVMMSISQSLISAVSMTWPTLTVKLMHNYGFRGTVAIFSAWSLNGILVMLTLQPSKWHFKRKRIIEKEIVSLTYDNDFESKKGDDPKLIPIETDRLFEESYLDRDGTDEPEIILKSNEIKSLNEVRGKWHLIVKTLDLALFKDPIYVNIAIGVSMAMTSDVMFLSLIPVLLNSYGFEKSEITLIFTVFFIADLVGRLILIGITALFRVWNRYVLLTGAVVTILFRIAYTIEFSFWWITIITALLGLFRCCVQVTHPLVFAEKYGSRFTAAFSLFMVVCGCINLSVGLIAAWVKDFTQSDIMVVHVLTIIYALCAVPWLIEIVPIELAKRRKA